MHVQTLDLSRFHRSESERLAFSQELLDGFQGAGFVKLINHGFSEEIMKQLFTWNEEFFSLSHEQKLAVANIVGPKPQRGWSAVGVEKTGTLNATGTINLTKVDHGKREDIKEHFDIGTPGDSEFPNLWPPECSVPEFRSWLEEYFEKSQQVTLDLLKALEIAFKVPEGTLTKRCWGPASELRLNHYPATPVKKLADNNAQRIWPHTDFGIITLLAQDDRGGLEIEDKDHPRSFIPVPLVDRTELVVNIGDTLERWTNGALRAGLHQVTLPRGVSESDETSDMLPSRLSVAFFLKANRDSCAGAIEHFVHADRPCRYEAMTALEYQRLRTNVVY